MRVFTYSDASREALERLVEPPDVANAVANVDHTHKLSAAGFVCVWDYREAQEMEGWGAILAKTRTQGALWPYQRAAWPHRDDPHKMARWALETDLHYYKSILEVFGGMNRASYADDADESSLATIEAAIETKVSQFVTLLRTRGAFTPDTIVALESAFRLGGYAAMMQLWMEALKV